MSNTVTHVVFSPDHTHAALEAAHKPAKDIAAAQAIESKLKLWRARSVQHCRYLTPDFVIAAAEARSLEITHAARICNLAEAQRLLAAGAAVPAAKTSRDGTDRTQWVTVNVPVLISREVANACIPRRGDGHGDGAAVVNSSGSRTGAASSPSHSPSGSSSSSSSGPQSALEQTPSGSLPVRPPVPATVLPTVAAERRVKTEPVAATQPQTSSATAKTPAVSAATTVGATATNHSHDDNLDGMFNGSDSDSGASDARATVNERMNDRNAVMRDGDTDSGASAASGRAGETEPEPLPSSFDADTMSLSHGLSQSALPQSQLC